MIDRHRKIAGDILWTKLATSPWPKTRPRGTKAQGVAFERKVAKALGPGACAGQWFRFCDANGPGFCQPDFHVVLPQVVLVLEVKLTDTIWAQSQLADLYLPVLSHFYSRPARGIVVCKNVRRDSGPAHLSLDAALRAPQRPFPVLHWLGYGPL